MANSELSILFPDQDRVTYAMIPEETWHDLGMDAVVEKVAKTPQEVPLLQRVMASLTPDPTVSRFRTDVFADLQALPEVRNRLMTLLDQVKTFYDYGVSRSHSGDDGLWDLMHRLEGYHDYILTVEAIRDCLTHREIRSEGLTRLRDAVDQIYESNSFAALKKDVEALRVSASNVRSLTVGINVNERFEAISMGLVSVNAKPFTHSGLLKHFVTAVTARDSVQPEADWNGRLTYEPASPPSILQKMESYALKSTAIRNPLLGLSLAAVPRDDGSAEVPHQMDTAASQLVNRLVRKLKEILAQYMNISVRDIANLIPELLFYVRWAEYLEALKEKGWRFCKPEVRAEGESSSGMEARGFYNLKLIGSVAPGDAVPNDLTFSGEKRIYVLTGANRGGKTTVTQAVGQLYLMAQSGLSVPADSFVFDPADRVLTHFPADEDKTLDLGRLGEECRRFRELYLQATERSLILLNESFSTTSFEEGYYIAVDALRAMLRKNARVIYNTHMHKLAFELDTAVNSPETAAKALSLVSVTEEGIPSFRVRVAPPEGKSFARPIAEKYGVTYEALTGLG
ncbi:MAG: DNA mismatch repair protein [Clostridia bacterium]|nr:DNA mismatch repair protein [Clostridia bacterium]